MTRGEMQRMLAERGIRLTKSLGQNFLHDGNQLRRIVDAAALGAGDRVLEVGPGLGPLTERLVQGAGVVVAIEKDARLVAVLQERLGGARALRLVEGDAMELVRPGAMEQGGGEVVSAFRTYCLGEAAMAGAEGAGGWEGGRAGSEMGFGWRLVSNLPYSVASPLMVDLGWWRYRPERMVVTLQWEVAQRLAARPRTAEYGVLTLLLGLDYEVARWFKVPSGCFYPAPAIDSACVTLVRRAQPRIEVGWRGTYRRLVKLGFSQRRKMMMKLLKGQWEGDRLAAAYERCGLALTVRAEELSVDEFVGLGRALESV